jgi:hypothetical protein
VEYVCPECGYNAGPNGEKLLEEHAQNTHATILQQLALSTKTGKEISFRRATLTLGLLPLILGLVLSIYGAFSFHSLSCQPINNPCTFPGYLRDQIRTSDFQTVYVTTQETVYMGLLLITLGSIILTYRRTRRLEATLFLGTFLLLFLTGLAIATQIIPFGQQIRFG